LDERQLLDLPSSKPLKRIKIVAPGRICLFGDHQDYLGLPVIACAIDKQLTLSAEKNTIEYFHILMPDLGFERRIPISEEFQNLKPQDYFASAIRVVRKYGCIPSSGYNILIKSSIPINAGVSSSSAVVVAFVHFLLKAFGCHQPISSELIAKLAYEAEVVEHNSPGGKMDQYTIAIGNILYIDTASDGNFKTIGISLPGLILAESGIPKETLGLLSEIRSKATQAIDLVLRQYPDFNLMVSTLEGLGPHSEYLPDELKPYFYAANKNHLITKEALEEFEKSSLNLQKIGRLMSEHHQILKNELKITVPRIDAMIIAALDAGAYGAKIVGSGGGGSIVALAPSDKTHQIIKAIQESGAKAVYEVSVTQGTYSE
jgi:galactokinase